MFRGFSHLRTPDRRVLIALVMVCTAVVVVTIALTTPLLIIPLLAAAYLSVRLLRHGHEGLQLEEIELLRQAELSLAAAATTELAARELADNAIHLLGASSAVVLIEGIGDTVRVGAGHGSGEVYGPGSKMRLLDDAGVPCGSIAVSARSNGKAYTERDERILDALAQRVSSTLHRLSLFAEIQGERGTLEDVLSSSSDGIFSTGSDHRILSWNPAMERITGVRASEAIGQQSSQIFRPVDENDDPRFGQADPGRSSVPTEALLVSIVTSRREQRWLTCSYSPLSAGGYVVVARDDTERKKLQDDKEGWIAEVSHELRTPLTPLKGFLHTLLRRDEQLGSVDRMKIYEVMLREEGRLEDMVNSLLQATAIEQGGTISVVAEALDWADLVGEQIDLFRRQDPSREIRLEVPKRVPRVHGDAQLCRGVVANLLSNALKYSPEGSPIVVRVTGQRGHVTTEVADAGPGVPATDRDRIFDKFTRLGDHLTRPQQGVGLGLFIVRESLERMGGAIRVEESALGGASFIVTLQTANTATTKKDRSLATA